LFRGREARPKPISLPALDEAQSPEKREIRFAMRNQTFRMGGRKPLKSLCTLNHSFRGFICFQRVKRGFVSPFSQSVLFWSKKFPYTDCYALPLRLRVGSGEENPVTYISVYRKQLLGDNEEKICWRDVDSQKLRSSL
jgi:hypothetical protein